MIRFPSFLSILFMLFALQFLLVAENLSAQVLTELGAANDARNEMMAGDAGSSPDNSGGNAGGGNDAGGGNNPVAADAKFSAGEKQKADEIIARGWWGSGGYFSITKIILFILVFWMWVFASDWMNGDMERLKNPNREAKNMINVGCYLLIGTIAFYIPIFLAAFPVALIAALTPPLLYARERNRLVLDNEKVLTREHLIFVAAKLLRKLGIKINVKERYSYEGGAPVELTPAGSGLSKQEIQGRLVVARNHPGFNALRDFLFDGLQRDADGILFDYQVQRTLVRHRIDGMWTDIADIPRPPESKRGDKGRLELALESAKLLTGGNPDERRAKNAGQFVAVLRKTNTFDATFVSQGTPTGERTLFEFSRKKAAFKMVSELGMSDAMRESLLKCLNAKQGFFVFAAPPTGGLRTTITLSLRECDRFTRDVACVEDRKKPYEAVENTMLTSYDSLRGENPMTVLPDIFFKEPNCVIINDMMNTESLTRCCNEVEKERLIITSVRAGDTVEAIYRLLAMKVKPQLLIGVVSAVIAQRLIRKLCPDCKESYTPPPQLLQQLRIPANTVKGSFYRARTPLPEAEERKRAPCATCNEIGYRGRTAIYELINFNDQIRAAFLSGKPDPVAVRKAIEASKQAGFLQAGIAAIIQGTTSVEELMRVMKQPAAEK